MMATKKTARKEIGRKVPELRKLADTELVTMVIDNDMPEAYQELVNRYDALVRSIVARFLVRDPMATEDACQETFLKALVRIRDLRNPERFKSWICAIARNQALDAIRKQKLVVSWDSTGGDESTPSWDLADQKASPEADHDRDVVIGVMRDVLGSIPQLYREPISLRYEEDMDYGEIAIRLDKPLGTVKSLIHRGKEIIREEVERRAGGYDAALVLAN
jgi:RNA polymerase sigma-70 factor, ECF subfamily